MVQCLVGGAVQVAPGEVKRYVEQINAHSRAIAALTLQKPEELQAGNIIVRSRLAQHQTAHQAVGVKSWLEDYLVRHSSEPFSLDELLAAVPGSHVEEARQEISLLCGNFFDTVFSQTVRRQLLEVEGRYRKASPQEIASTLAPFDKILLSIIVSLDFENPKIIPKLENNFGFNFPSDRGLDDLLRSILNSGMLLKSKENDVLFCLDEEWEWPEAFQCFIQSSHLWHKKLDGRKVTHGPSVSKIPSVFPEIVSIDFNPTLANSRPDEVLQSETSAAVRAISQASTSTDELQQPTHIELKSVRSSEPEINVQWNNSDFDQLYLALVVLLKAMGNPLKISRNKLVERLSIDTSLSRSEIKKLLAGNKPGAPTPLVVREAMGGRRWLDVQEGSLAEVELIYLPETRAAWSDIPGIASSRPNRKNVAVRVVPTERVERLPPLMQRADVAYLEILRKIESMPLQLVFKKHFDLVHYIAQETPTHPGLTRLLLLGKIPDCPRLFYPRLEKSKVGFRLNPALAKHYPSIVKELREHTYKHPWINPYGTQILFQVLDGKGGYPAPALQSMEGKEKIREKHDSVKKEGVSKKNMAHLIRIADEYFSRLVKLAVAHGNPIKRNENSDVLMQANRELTEALIKIRRINTISGGRIPNIIKTEISEVDGSPLQVVYEKRYAVRLKKFPKTKHALNHGYFVLKRKGVD